jgi:signal transduction histidine kinase
MTRVKEPPVRTPPMGRTAVPRAPQGVPDQFAQLQEQFELLKARVRQAQQLAGLGSVGPTLAHEVNNLLTPIIGYATSALSSNDPELMTKALRVTVQNARIVVSMADRLLKLSAAKPAERTAVDVRQAVDNACAGLCRDLSRDGITFAVHVPANLAVRADELQFQQVLFNLFLNAREAMKGAHNGRLSVRAFPADGTPSKGKAVDVSRAGTSNAAGSHDESNPPSAQAGPSEASPRRVTIEVTNSGPAIPPDILPHIFDAFQSSKPITQGDAKCSGLGLALCRDLIEENDGTIRVTSDADRGTTFILTLPEAKLSGLHDPAH